MVFAEIRSMIISYTFLAETGLREECTVRLDKGVCACVQDQTVLSDWP